MSLRRLPIFLCTLLVLAWASGASAGHHNSPHGGCGGWGAGTPYDRAYDPKKMVELDGEVGVVSRVVPRPGMVAGECFELLLADGDSFPVHLGPAYFLDARHFHLETGDHVHLRAAKVHDHDNVVLMAAEVTRGEDVLELRDGDGYPLWVPREDSSP